MCHPFHPLLSFKSPFQHDARSFGHIFLRSAGNATCEMLRAAATAAAGSKFMSHPTPLGRAELITEKFIDR
jgi:hypothetical protein